LSLLEASATSAGKGAVLREVSRYLAAPLRAVTPEDSFGDEGDLDGGDAGWPLREIAVIGRR